GPDGYEALEALRGESVFGSATPDVRFPTCYSDSFYVGPAPAEGKRIVVTLTVGDQPSVHATATVHHLTRDAHPARELGCPRDPDGHFCSGTLATKRLTIRLETAYATSCGVARAVMKRVS